MRLVRDEIPAAEWPTPKARVRDPRCESRTAAQHRWSGTGPELDLPRPYPTLVVHNPRVAVTILPSPTVTFMEGCVIVDDIEGPRLLPDLG